MMCWISIILLCFFHCASAAQPLAPSAPFNMFSPQLKATVISKLRQQTPPAAEETIDDLTVPAGEPVHIVGTDAEHPVTINRATFDGPVTFGGDASDGDIPPLPAILPITETTTAPTPAPPTTTAPFFADTKAPTEAPAFPPGIHVSGDGRGTITLGNGKILTITNTNGIVTSTTTDLDGTVTVNDGKTYSITNTNGVVSYSTRNPDGTVTTKDAVGNIRTTNTTQVCFPPLATVQMKTGERVSMEALRVGDVVRTGEARFEPVVFFSRHWAGEGWTRNDALVQGSYLNITLRSGATLPVSSHTVLISVSFWFGLCRTRLMCPL
jgi:hypothetical protein